MIRAPGSMNYLFVEYMFRMGRQSTHRFLQFDKYRPNTESSTSDYFCNICHYFISALVDVDVVKSNAVSSRLCPPIDFHYNRQHPRSHKNTLKALGTPKSSTPCSDPCNQKFENHHSTAAMPKIPPTNPSQTSILHFHLQLIAAEA